MMGAAGAKQIFSKVIRAMRLDLRSKPRQNFHKPVSCPKCHSAGSFKAIEVRREQIGATKEQSVQVFSGKPVRWIIERGIETTVWYCENCEHRLVEKQNYVRGYSVKTMRGI